MGSTDLLPENQKIFIILTGFTLLIVVVELIRRRKMLEQYSAIWLFISLCAVCFIWIYPMLVWLTKLIGAGFTTSTILFCGLIALMLLNLQLSVKISEFAFHIKDIIQELTLLNDKIEKLNQRLCVLENKEGTSGWRLEIGGEDSGMRHEVGGMRERGEDLTVKTVNKKRRGKKRPNKKRQ